MGRGKAVGALGSKRAAKAKPFLEDLSSFLEGSLSVYKGHDWLPCIFSNQCTRIRQELRKREASSVTQSAKRLQRDRTAVQKNLVFLEVLGLVGREGEAVAVGGVERAVVVTAEPV